MLSLLEFCSGSRLHSVLQFGKEHQFAPTGVLILASGDSASRIVCVSFSWLPLAVGDEDFHHSLCCIVVLPF